jgi:hypothetical protein
MKECKGRYCQLSFVKKKKTMESATAISLALGILSLIASIVSSLYTYSVDKAERRRENGIHLSSLMRRYVELTRNFE